MSRWQRLEQVAGSLPWLLCAYFVAHIVIRVLISPNLGKDEAEQVLMAQELAWGYGPQPPFYTWLASGVFAVFGQGIFALTLLKNSLLAATYLLTFATAWRISKDRVVAAVAALSLLLLPQIAWESQRDLTHSVLVLFAAALFTYAMLRVLEEGRLWSYALLGVAFSIGVLAKYNFPIMAVALLGAALSMAPFRARILNPRFLLSAAIAGLLLWRPLLWALENTGPSLRQTGKLILNRTDSLLVNYASGLSGLLVATLAFLGPMLVIYGVLLFRSKRGRMPGDSERNYVALLFRSLVLALVASAVLVMAFEVTKVKDRWMQPLLYAAPIVAALWSSRYLTPARIAALLGIAALCAATVLVMLPVRTVVAPAFGRTNPLNAPFPELATQIRAAGFERGGIIAAFNLLGGNLRFRFPQSPVVTQEYPNFALPEGGPYLVVWDATVEPRIPQKVTRLFERRTGRTLPEETQRYIDAPMLYSARERMKLGFIIVPQLRPDAGIAR